MSEVKKSGRPTIYTEELGFKICRAVATHSLGLNRLTAMFDWMPTKETINEWRWSKEVFSAQYTKAKIAQAELMTEDCLDIADDVTHDKTINKNGDEVCNNEAVNRSRLRVDTRKWLAAKLLPKIYGERLQKEPDSDTKDLLSKLIDRL